MTVRPSTSHTRSACERARSRSWVATITASPSSARSATYRQLDPAGDVEERRRFVEHEHRRLLGEGPGNQAALPLPVGELAERPAPERGDPESVGGAHEDVVVAQRTTPVGVWVPAERDDVTDGQPSGVDPVGEHDGDCGAPGPAGRGG